jgi:hypothetical protein
MSNLPAKNTLRLGANRGHTLLRASVAAFSISGFGDGKNTGWISSAIMERSLHIDISVLGASHLLFRNHTEADQGPFPIYFNVARGSLLGP